MQQITGNIVKHAQAVSGAPGQPVDAPALAAAEQSIVALAKSAPTPAQGVQAVDNAASQVATQGANTPVLQMLQKVLGMLQQELTQSSPQRGGSQGAQIRG